MRRFALLAALSAAALLLHAVLAASLGSVDLVEELLVHRSATHASMAAALIGARCFLVFVVPAWLAALLTMEIVRRTSRR